MKINTEQSQGVSVPVHPCNSNHCCYMARLCLSYSGGCQAVICRCCVHRRDNKKVERISMKEDSKQNVTIRTRTVSC